MRKEIPSEVLKRAKTLCAISDNPSSSTYEIEMALKQAHDILLPFGLTVEEILSSVRRDIIEENYHIPGRRRRTNWLSDLMHHIARFTDTSYMFRTGFRVEYMFVGLLSQVQRAVFHAETLYEQIEYYGENRAPRYMRDIRIYKQGIVDRIRVTMRDLKSRNDMVSESRVAPMVDAIQATPEGNRLLMVAPTTAADIANYKLGDFNWIRVDGDMYLVDALPKLQPDHPIEIVIDRIVMREGIRTRIETDLMRGLRLTGEVYVENADTAERMPFRVEESKPKPSLLAMNKLKTLIRSHIDEQVTHYRSGTTRSWDASNYNPDYSIGYQHGAEIKLRDGIGRRWQ